MSTYESHLPLRGSILNHTTQLAYKYRAYDLGQGFTSERPELDMCVRACSGFFGGTRKGAEALVDKVMSESENQTFYSMLKSLPQPSFDVMNHYSYPFGSRELRQAVADYYKRVYDLQVDPETEVTITLGATEGLSIALRTLVGPGNGVIFFQPFHELYVNQCISFCVHPLLATLRKSPPDGKIHTVCEEWTIDFEELEKIMDTATFPVKALVINSPHNPTGRVYTDEELRRLCEMCFARNIWVITDEIYEHIIFGGRFEGRRGPHQTVLWTWKEPEYREKVLIVDGLSKTGICTGWRVGWILSPPSVTPELRNFHTAIALQSPTMVQFGAEALLRRPLSFFTNDIPGRYAKAYNACRKVLRDVGFDFSEPEGAYYVFTSYDRIPPLAPLDSKAASDYLIQNVGVAAAPGYAFYDTNLLPSDQTNRYLRFAFCRSIEYIEGAMARLKAWKANGYEPLHDDENVPPLP